MANQPQLDQFMNEVRAAVVDLLLSNESGTVTIHCSRTNQLRREINRNGEAVQLAGHEMTSLRMVQHIQN